MRARSESIPIEAGGVTINVNENTRFQQFEGGGASFTDTAAWLMNSSGALSQSTRDDTMRKARMCYDHIAGELGVALADSLQQHHHIELADDGGIVTESGEAFFHKIGIDLSAARGGGATYK